MLSALTGIQTDTIVNYTITKSFICFTVKMLCILNVKATRSMAFKCQRVNERKCVSELIKNLTNKDTVILDRGYYSKKLFCLFHTSFYFSNKKIQCKLYYEIKT
jgi:hypothetical protein